MFPSILKVLESSGYRQKYFISQREVNLPYVLRDEVWVNEFSVQSRLKEQLIKFYTITYWTSIYFRALFRKWKTVYCTTLQVPFSECHLCWSPRIREKDVIFKTLTVFNRVAQTPRRKLKMRHKAEYSWRSSRFLYSRWNFLSSVSYIYLINRNKHSGVNGAVNSSKSMLIMTGYPNLLQI